MITCNKVPQPISLTLLGYTWQAAGPCAVDGCIFWSKEGACCNPRHRCSWHYRHWHQRTMCTHTHRHMHNQTLMSCTCSGCTWPMSALQKALARSPGTSYWQLTTIPIPPAPTTEAVHVRSCKDACTVLPFIGKWGGTRLNSTCTLARACMHGNARKGHTVTDWSWSDLQGTQELPSRLWRFCPSCSARTRSAKKFVVQMHTKTHVQWAWLMLRLLWYN